MHFTGFNDYLESFFVFFIHFFVIIFFPKTSVLSLSAWGVVVMADRAEPGCEGSDSGTTCFIISTYIVLSLKTELMLRGWDRFLLALCILMFANVNDKEGGWRG